MRRKKFVKRIEGLGFDQVGNGRGQRPFFRKLDDVSATPVPNSEVLQAVERLERDNGNRFGDNRQRNRDIWFIIVALEKKVRRGILDCSRVNRITNRLRKISFATTRIRFGECASLAHEIKGIFRYSPPD